MPMHRIKIPQSLPPVQYPLSQEIYHINGIKHLVKDIATTDLANCLRTQMSLENVILI